VGFEAGAVVREEGAGGFFEAGEVAGEGGEEAVGGFVGLADLVAGGVGAAGVVDEAAEGGGGAAGLGGEPVPGAGEEGDFAGDDAEAGAAAGGGGRRRDGGGGEGCGGGGRGAEVEVDLAAGRVVEDQEFPALGGILHECKDLGVGAVGDLGEAPEDGEGHGLILPG